MRCQNKFQQSEWNANNTENDEKKNFCSRTNNFFSFVVFTYFLKFIRFCLVSFLVIVAVVTNRGEQRATASMEENTESE